METMREEYIAGKISHDSYYGGIVKEAGISYAKSHLLPRIKQALADGDEHLNSIPLAVWDRQQMRPISSRLANAFKSRGDYATAAGLVCVHKQAAIMAVKGESNENE